MTSNEFFEAIWWGYPKDLCHNKKGSKFTAQKAAEKIKPQEYQRIIDNMKALIRYDNNDPKPDRWPHVSTWLNQGYYDREIDSGEQRQRIELSTCSVKNCDNEVHGPRFSRCTDHYLTKETDRWYQRRLEAGIELGLLPKQGESRSEWVQRCRQLGRPGLQRLKSGKLPHPS